MPIASHDAARRLRRRRALDARLVSHAAPSCGRRTPQSTATISSIRIEIAAPRPKSVLR